MDTRTSSVRVRIEQLRDCLRQQGVHALLVPSADPHLSEYLPQRWQTRVWLSGFTGSMGTLAVTLDQAVLFADSRYWEQAAKELTSYTVYRWECAVRASVVMGFVGAGGLGQLMDQAMKMLNGGEAASILLAFMLLTLAALPSDNADQPAVVLAGLVGMLVGSLGPQALRNQHGGHHHLAGVKDAVNL